MTHIFTDLEFSDDIEIREQALNELADRLSQSPIDTRQALAGYTPQADEFQALVIKATERTIRVVAPAGSGKTQTVVNRTLNRIGKGIKPERILMLTFDRAAASSITSKMGEQLEQLGANFESPPIKTLNAFGYQVLREHIPEEFKNIAPRYRQFRLFREVKDALKQKSPQRHNALPYDLKHAFYLDLFSLFKNELFDPRKLNNQALTEFLIDGDHAHAEALFVDPQDRVKVEHVIQSLIWMFVAYERVLQREEIIDFDDQKLRAFVVLQDNSSLRDVIQRKYDEIIVDEFQDINKLDFVFIKLISALAVLVVTGDDDQAIYGFRGCTPEYIINLQKHIGDGRTVASYELSKNYRCPPNIVEAADRLIRHNSWRIPKNPVPASSRPAQIKVLSGRSAGVEAKLVVKFINQVRKKNKNLPFNEFAVLYRTNAQSLPLQVEFILKSIPYHVRKEDNILENKVLDRLMGVLRLKLALNKKQEASPDDCVLAVEAYFRYLDNKKIDVLRALFSTESNFLTVINSEDFYTILPKARESQLSTAIAEVLSAKTLIDTLDVLAKRFKGLKGMIGSLEEVADNRVPLGEIYEVAANFRGKTHNFVKTLEEALAKARAMNAGRDEEGGVRLSTYFRAKGLQWHSVILAGCNEGLIPHSKAPLEEERRLFYVAITRAQSNLLISYVKNVAKNNVKPSRFLKEAGLL